MNRVLKLFRPNSKLSEFNNLSLNKVYGFVATLRFTLDKQAQEKQPPKRKLPREPDQPTPQVTLKSSSLNKARRRRKNKLATTLATQP